MASDFPIVYYTGPELGPMNLYFFPKSTATFKAEQLVVQSTSDQTVDECGADPALILGIAKGNAADKFLWADITNVGRVPVSVLNPAVRIGLCVSGTLVAASVGKTYGITKLASGNWAMDIAKQGGASDRVYVQAVDLTNQIAWVNFLAANLQADAIAS